MGPFEKAARSNIIWAQFILWVDVTLLDWALGWPVSWYLVPLGILIFINVVGVAGFAWARKETLEIALRDTYSRALIEEAYQAAAAAERESLDEAGQHALDLVEDAKARRDSGEGT